MCVFVYMFCRESERRIMTSHTLLVFTKSLLNSKVVQTVVAGII